MGKRKLYRFVIQKEPEEDYWFGHKGPWIQQFHKNGLIKSMTARPYCKFRSNGHVNDMVDSTDPLVSNYTTIMEFYE